MKKTSLLFLCFMLPISFVSTKRENVSNVNAAGTDDSEMIKYINNNIPSGWYRYGSIETIEYQDEYGYDRIEKYQIITTDTLKQHDFVASTE